MLRELLILASSLQGLGIGAIGGAIGKGNAPAQPTPYPPYPGQYPDPKYMPPPAYPPQEYAPPQMFPPPSAQNYTPSPENYPPRPEDYMTPPQEKKQD